MSTSNEDPDIEGFQVYSFISQLEENGATSDEIRQKLIEKGMKADEAAGFANRLISYQIKKEIRTQVTSLLNQGKKSEEIERQLVQKGFEKKLVGEILTNLQVAIAREEKEQRESPRRLWFFMGITIFILGAGLCFGNISGLFPTISYAGYSTMSIGVMIYLAARIGEE